METVNEGNIDNEVAGQVDGIPYAIMEANSFMQLVMVLAKPADIKIYADHEAMRAATKEAMSRGGQNFGAIKDIDMAGEAAGAWTVARSSDPAQWHAGYTDEVTEIVLNAHGMEGGIILEKGWRLSMMPVISELVAAHRLWNTENGTAFEVRVEPDARRFGNEFKDTAIIGSSMPVELFGFAMRKLAASGYGTLKFARVSEDQCPQVQIGARVKTWAWKKIHARVGQMVWVTGFDMDEYGDSTASGEVLGLLCHLLGDVSVARVSAARGFTKTKRVLVEFALSDAPEIFAKLEAVTAAAKGGQGIKCCGRLVTVVKGTTAATEVYENLHKLQVSETAGEGGGQLKEQIAGLADKLAEAEEKAATEAAASAGRQGLMAEELQQLGEQAVTMGAALEEAARDRERAEVLAAAAREEARKAALEVTHLTEMLRRMAGGGLERLEGGVARLEGGASAAAEIVMVESATSDSLATQVAEVHPGGKASAEAATRRGAGSRGTGAAGHAAGVAGRLRATALLLCMAATSPMSNAGSESASRACGAWSAECRVGGKSGNTPGGGGGGAVSRSGVWVGPVCESSAALLERGGVGGGARDSSIHLRPQLPPRAQFSNCSASPANAALVSFCTGRLWWGDSGRGGERGGDGSAVRRGGPGEADDGHQEEVERERGRGARAMGGEVRHELDSIGGGRSAAGADGSGDGEPMGGPAAQRRDSGADAGSGRVRDETELVAAGAVAVYEVGRSDGELGGGELEPGGADGREEGPGAADEGAAVRGGGGDGYRQCEEASTWQELDHCPQEGGAGRTRGGAARGEEGGGVGHRWVWQGEGDGVPTGGGDASEGGGRLEAVGGAEGQAAHADGHAGAGAAREWRRGGWGSTDAGEGGGGAAGHQSAIGGVAGGGARAVGGGAVARDGGLTGWASRAGVVVQRRGDGEGEGQDARGAGAAVCGDVRGGARCHLHGRQGEGVAAEIRGGGGGGSTAARMPQQGVLHPEGATVRDGEQDGGGAGDEARRVERDAIVPAAVAGTAGGGGEGRGGEAQGRAGVAAQGAGEAIGGRGGGAEGGGEVRADGDHDRGDGRSAAATTRDALQQGADGAAKLAVRLAPCGERLRGVGGGASPEATVVGGRAARLAGGGVRADGARVGGGQGGDGGGDDGDGGGGDGDGGSGEDDGGGGEGDGGGGEGDGGGGEGEGGGGLGEGGGGEGEGGGGEGDGEGGEGDGGGGEGDGGGGEGEGGGDEGEDAASGRAAGKAVSKAQALEEAPLPEPPPKGCSGSTGGYEYGGGTTRSIDTARVATEGDGDGDGDGEGDGFGTWATTTCPLAYYPPPGYSSCPGREAVRMPDHCGFLAIRPMAAV